MIALTGLVLSFLFFVRAAPTDWTIHDSRASVPLGFVRSGPAASDHILDMRINLAQGNLAGLERALESASSPTSPKFRQWLSSDQVNSFVKPDESTIAAVTQWISALGIDYKSITPAGDWIAFKVPISTASKMLNAQFSVYTHASSGKQYVRTLEYSLPSALQTKILAIHPTTSFSGPSRGPAVLALAKPDSMVSTLSNLTSDAVPSNCNSTITPTCLQALYGIPTTAAKSASNSIGVTGMVDQFANKGDLAKFLTKFRPDMSSSTTFGLTSVDGGINSQNASDAGAEANLDIQYTVGVATGVPVTFVSVGDNYQDGDDSGFLDIINALLGESAPPQVLTTSYGLDVESDLSKSLSVALCNSYMQLTSRGVSILFATGDGGVASTPGVQCNGTFPPTFPTCPYVTLVGATEDVPEKGAELSAGGFSNYFATASWQSSAVSNYLTILGSEYSGKFNRSGRAYPDVSAQGQRVQIFINGNISSVRGTSCSSPIFASIVGLLNDELITAGKNALGFLNPWLYANPGAFNDITTGNNPGCGTKGFPAAKGWDPVTGLGSPNYAALRTAAGL
ncbi:hypothetical protein PILCRDRAFT_814248 [Piloderma croceum F 1598]|uniref:Peptidase S53 domain-containing protein n=1 Tax=Piloderma croceum (strain F 1598) TaxID=765440 RepID=A0A0C3FV93_PILCF|nr:hypothetical protein PILCRDRAFT_814248 [Piloderma croceum F 1598]